MDIQVPPRLSRTTFKKMICIESFLMLCEQLRPLSIPRMRLILNLHKGHHWNVKYSCWYNFIIGTNDICPVVGIIDLNAGTNI